MLHILCHACFDDLERTVFSRYIALRSKHYYNFYFIRYTISTYIFYVSIYIILDMVFIIDILLLANCIGKVD